MSIEWLVKPPEFNLAAAHRFFAADCFNRTWELIDLPARSPVENEQMLLAAMASVWHWTQRAEVSARELSIGCWQVSRVYALLGQAANAADFGERCLRHSTGLAPFYIGYAHEALARAARLAGDDARMRHHLDEARKCVATVTDQGEREALEKDLVSIQAELKRVSSPRAL